MNAKFWLILFTASLGYLCASAGGGSTKGGQLVVSIHMQGGEDATQPELITPVKLGTEHKQYYFIKIPIFTDRDFLWYYPFVSQDGNSHGVAFKLKEERIPLLTKISSEHQGKLLGTRVVDAPLNAILIDQPVTDGVIVIWDGLAKSHLQVIDTKVKHYDSFNSGGQTPNLPTFTSDPSSTTQKPKFNLFNKKKGQKIDQTNPYTNPQ